MAEKQSSALVSVVIPVFNSGRLLLDALDSVWRQSYRPIEVIVVDDGSTDDTPLLFDEWRSQHASGDFRCVGIQQANTGASSARNKGLAVCEGRFLQFLDADDLLLPGKIKAQVERLNGAHESLAYGPWKLCYEKKGMVTSEIWRQEQPLPPNEDPMKLHLGGWYSPVHGYLWPIQLVRDVGLWDESLFADQDADYVMRALVLGARLVFSPEPAAVYRIHSASQVSRGSGLSQLHSRFAVVDKMERLLGQKDTLDKYREVLASRYYELQRMACLESPELADRCLQRARHVAPGSRAPIVGGTVYRLARRLLGLRASEWLSRKKREYFARYQQ